MNINRVTYFALGAFVFAASCSKEAAEPDVYDWADGNIYFKTSLAYIAYSRGQDMTLGRLESFQVTCFNTADRDIDQAGFLSPYFENATFIRKTEAIAGTAFVSSPAEGPRDWPSNDGLLKFFAFAPSLTEMASDNSALENDDNSEYFNLTNSSSETQSKFSVSYRLGKVRINPDISRQFDFVTAEAAGERWKDFAGGVDLAFSHQLCQVELKAWGSGERYRFDIAGVRIGNPVIEGTFVFADDTQNSVGRWETPKEAVKDPVEYLFRDMEMSQMEGQQVTGDKIFRINGEEHNTHESAASIMGQGGSAMVIPTKNDRWEGLDDPNINLMPYSTGRMYFSILMRVTDVETGNVVYPYPGNKKGMTVVSYAIDSSGKIVRRLYAGQTATTYFTDPELKNPYIASRGEEIADFGWAAVPVDADWQSGKKYVYTLNYSEGIGLHDPADPEPGKLIVGQTPVEWSVKVSGWDYATPDGDNYNPDLNVP